MERKLIFIGSLIVHDAAHLELTRRDVNHFHTIPIRDLHIICTGLNETATGEQ
jgi:hypothetical protein